ncbi:B9 domain-containing protein 1 isoform X2 [Galleria mellonella]|uniref:B9 domain-containing protein 1 n=1 Tax=Galleria mellonella TaxID=7137 RepID=A0ABM3N757_GALME|nr:B9 domain-containing protein 1 isoform X2 [Galleria mellonella]
MKGNDITKFLVSFSGQVEFVSFPAGVFDEQVYIQYEIIWGPDWESVSGLATGSSQMSRSGPQLLITVRAQNRLSGDSLLGYALILMPPTCGTRVLTAPLVRPQAATVFGEWLAWLTGRRPELADPKMLASGKENYLLRTESYDSVTVSLSMVSKDLRKLGYDNQPPAVRNISDT